MHRLITPVLLVVFWLASCSLDDHMTCPLGFVKSTQTFQETVIPPGGGPPETVEKTIEVCIEPYDTGPDETDSDTGTTEPEDSDTSDAGGDAGQQDSDTSGASGLLEPCSAFGEGGDCAGFEANFCAFDPFSETGYCTYQNCTPGSCPDEAPYCCDCSNFVEGVNLIWGVACLKLGEAFLASSNGCNSCTPDPTGAQ